MAQKVIRIGSSHGVTIRKALLEKAGIKPGSEVLVEFDETNGAIRVISARQQNYARDIAAAQRLFAMHADELQKLGDD